MKFAGIIGEVKTNEQKLLINNCQTYLSQVFAELSAGWSINTMGSKLGGDPLWMQLVAPMNHYCDLTGYNFLPLKKAEAKINRKMDLNLPLTKKDQETLIDVQAYKQRYPRIIETAATDGKVFYWAPHFVLSKTKVGVRLLIGHEGTHAALLHPNRRGHRIPSLWNISIDFKANFNQIDDLRQRGFSRPEEIFKQLADFVSLEEYASFVRNPYQPPEKMEPFSPRVSLQRMLQKDYVETDYEDPIVLYAAPYLNKDMRQPEVIYDYLMKQVPVCDKCGNLFCYKIPDDVKDMKRELAKIQEQNAKNGI